MSWEAAAAIILNGNARRFFADGIPKFNHKPDRNAKMNPF